MRVFVTGGSGFLGQRLIPMLRSSGHGVRALARSPVAARLVEYAGAEPISGDLDNMLALRKGMATCDAVIHAAALISVWGQRKDFHRTNVTGTRNVIEAARAAGVRRLLYVGAAIVVLGDRPAIGADETWPKSRKPVGDYAASKAAAEDMVIAANLEDLETVVVRPPAIWGHGDRVLLPSITQAVKKDYFVWINNGRYPYSTCNVANASEGIILALEKGAPGNIYFLTDGDPLEFRSFITGLVGTQGLKPGDRSVSLLSAKTMASFIDAVWWTFRIKRRPPMSRQVVKLVGEPLVISDAKARRELGYKSSMTFEKGLAEIEPIMDESGGWI